jgi:anti-sigma regulatory factor (Ser/Thr protein kinase)
MEAAVSGAQDFSVVVSDSSHAAAARIAAQRMARALEFDETREGRVGIVSTEAVTNMLKHAGGGTFAARGFSRGGTLGIEMLAIDSGPGMADVVESSRDGVSTTGTQGSGLGAMKRQADEMEVYSLLDRGTIVRLLIWGAQAPERGSHEVGAVCIPKPGENICGDAWEVVFHPRGATFMVADGLGHGPDAHRAAATALEALRKNPDHPAVRILDGAHGKLRPTRGAAVAVIRHDGVAGEVDFAGIGNISATLLNGAERKAMVSHNGIVGHNVHKSQEYRYAWPRGAVLVAHSDGLETQWDLGSQAGLAHQHPSVIAAALYREHSRRRDDCTVVVARAL